MELIPDYKEEPAERKNAVFLFLQSIGVSIKSADDIPTIVHYGLSLFRTRDLLAKTVIEKYNSGYTKSQIMRKYKLSTKEVDTIFKRYKRGQKAK